MSKQKDEAIYRKGWNDGFAKGATAARFQLEAEIAELRELVRRLYWMADFCRNCPDSERCDVDTEWLGCTVGDPIKAQMEELGVEI